MTEHILDLLVAEKKKLDRAIAALQGDNGVPDWVTGKKSSSSPAPAAKSAEDKESACIAERDAVRALDAHRKEHRCWDSNSAIPKT
jgi:hypothetical protein